MAAAKKKSVGQTKDAGFQVGVRRTIPISSDTAWEVLFSEKGVAIWLGDIDPDKLNPGQEFATSEGLKGEVRVYKPHSHIRLRWKPNDWENSTTLQIRVIPNKEKTTISFHQEHLANSQQRNEMKAHWSAILDLLAAELTDR